MRPKLKIITLYCGENEYEACKQSVQDQNYDGVIDHHFIENLSNIAAHQACYQTIMDAAGDYDLFIKLDADMVFNRTTAIHDILDCWNIHHRPDHMVFAVHDFIPDRLSIGIHVFSNKCRWNLNVIDPLFVDPNPAHPMTSIKIWGAPAPFVTHAGQPSDEGAYHFGVHRALKAFQPCQFWKQPQAIEAFRIIQATADHYQRTQNPQAKLALMGAESIRRGLIKTTNGDKTNIKIIDTDIQFWMRPIKAKLWWWCLYGVRAVPIFIYRQFTKRT